MQLSLSPRRPRSRSTRRVGGSQGAEVSVDGESGESSQSDAQTVAHAGCSHRELSVSVLRLFADEVEGVDVRGSTQQTLVEDDSKHNPGTRQKQVLHREQEKHGIHYL